MTQQALLRSVLYVPGSNDRALRKSRHLAVDALILDLEDSVPPDGKDRARQSIAAYLAAGPRRDCLVTVRVNDRASPWFAADLAAVAATDIHAVVVPKVNDIADLQAVRRDLDLLGGSAIRLWAMIETARCLIALPQLADASRNHSLGLDCHIMGTNDLVRETKASAAHGRTYLLPWLMQVVAAARAGDICVLDGVYNDISDREGFQADCRFSRNCGFDGRTVIHPRQVTLANVAYAPTQDEITDALGVVDAFARAGTSSAVAMVGGRMVERLHLQQAETLLARAAKIDAAASYAKGDDETTY